MGSAIRATGIVKRYGELAAVDGLDLVVERGTCLALLGPNGAGKTTTIEILEGLTTPDAGEVELLGRSWHQDAQHIRAGIGVQLQETHLPELLSVFEVLRLFSSFYSDCRGEAEVLELVGLEEKRGARVKELSGGQKQRLALGCALIHRPEILFLDEPTTGLDPQGRRRVWEIVGDFKRAGGTVLLTTHYMEEAERLSDRVVIIDHGRMLRAGTARELSDALAAENILEFRLARAAGGSGATPEDAGPDLAAAEAWLAELDGVTSVRVTGGHLHLGVQRFERVLPRLIAALEQRGLELADLNMHRPTLEDVFISMTGRGLEDAGAA